MINSIPTIRTLALTAAFASALLGCKDKTEPFKYESVLASEAKVFAVKLGRALEQCTKNSMRSVFDAEGMMRLAAKGFRKDIRKQIIEAAATMDLTTLCRRQGGTLKSKHLRMVATWEYPRVLFRLLHPDSAIEYVEFHLGKRKGKVVAFDLFSYSMGRLYSRTAHDIGMALKRVPGMSGVEMKEAVVLTNAGKYKEALRVLRLLPLEVRKTSALMLFEIRITSNMNDKLYIASLDKFRAAYPDNPAVDMQEIDRAFLSKRYKDALAAMERLSRRIGGDAFLDTKRAETYLRLNDVASAAKYVRAALEREPGVVPARLKTWLAGQKK